MKLMGARYLFGFVVLHAKASSASGTPLSDTCKDNTCITMAKKAVFQRRSHIHTENGMDTDCINVAGIYDGPGHAEKVGEWTVQQMDCEVLVSAVDQPLEVPFIGYVIHSDVQLSSPSGKYSGKVLPNGDAELSGVGKMKKRKSIDFALLGRAAYMAEKTRISMDTSLSSKKGAGPSRNQTPANETPGNHSVKTTMKDANETPSGNASTGKDTEDGNKRATNDTGEFDKNLHELKKALHNRSEAEHNRSEAEKPSTWLDDSVFNKGGDTTETLANDTSGEGKNLTPANGTSGHGSSRNAGDNDQNATVR